MAPRRVVFMGSPEFALPTLKALAEEYPIVGIITQPDRPAGRGRSLTPPPVKLLSQDLGLPTIQPRRLREPEAMEQLRRWEPDLIVVAAFGQILRPDVLELPPFGCINVHGSLLPRWRGAAPVQAAILAGDSSTGITIMKMDPGIDTGPILSQRSEPILTTDTARSLSDRLANIGADLLIETLPGYLGGTILPVSQDESRATYAPILKKEDGLLDFTMTCEFLARQVRAYQPWPGAYMIWQDQMLKILRVSAVIEETSIPIGQTTRRLGYPAVGTSDGLLILEELQPAGKRAMSGKDFLSGAKQWG